MWNSMVSDVSRAANRRERRLVPWSQTTPPPQAIHCHSQPPALSTLQVQSRLPWRAEELGKSSVQLKRGREGEKK